MTETRMFLLIALLGHLLCGFTDCLMSFTPHGRFAFSDARDAQRMAKLFDGMSGKRLILSLLLGAFALCMASLGYLAISDWMETYSHTASVILRVSGLLFIVPITAHHVCCAAVEWFYVRLGRGKDALDTVMDFFQKTSPAMMVGYGALLTFSATLIVMVAGGQTGLPWWMCFFSTLPVYLALLPTKLPAKGNIAGSVMFFALLMGM